MDLAGAHMKKDHAAEFGAPPAIIPPPAPPPKPSEPIKVPKVLGAVPAEVLEYINALTDQKIQAALEAERPHTAKAVGEAIAQVITDMRAAGIPIPALDAPGAPAVGGPGSTVTPLGGALLNYLTRPEPGGDIMAFIKQAQQFKAIGELFNPPPGLADRIITSAYIKNLKKLGLVTDNAASALDKELFPSTDP